jgi:hypothetical protein
VEYAMKMLSRFVAKFTSLIVAVRSCFDRVIFRGHLPIANGPSLEGYVDHALKIRRCDSMAVAERQAEDLVRVLIAGQAVTNDLMVADSDKNSARSDKGRGPARHTVYDVPGGLELRRGAVVASRPWKSSSTPPSRLVCSSP